MELFNSKYVHCVWDESLKGKEVFYSDYIQCIKEEVNDYSYRRDTRGICEAYNSDNIDNPFIICSRQGHVHTWKYVYYDPNYVVKRAYNEGKKIQYRYRAQEEWHDVQNENDFNTLIGQLSDCPNRLSLRIKPEEQKRMTYRQLAEWLVNRNGQYKDNYDNTVYTDINYVLIQDKEEVPADYKIRKFGSDEWIEPTVDIYNADCITKGRDNV